MIGAAVGGENIGETVEGLARFPISVRYPRELRDSVEALRMLPIVTERGAQLPLSAIATRARRRRPADAEERERAAVGLGIRRRPRPRPRVGRARCAGGGRARSEAAAGYSVSWSGQFEYLERAKARLAYVVPFTLLVIFVLLYLAFRRVDEALLIMLAVPFALVGGYWLLWLLGYATSVATAVGFIALAGRRRRVRRRDAPVPAPRVGGAPRARRARDARDAASRRSRRAPCCACGPRR